MPNDPFISLQDFKLLLDVGCKICEQMGHHLFKNPINGDGSGPAHWQVCFATLPKNLGIRLKHNSFPALTVAGLAASDASLIFNEPGHRRVSILSTPEADVFLNDLAPHTIASHGKNPNYFLTTVERAFIRLDIAKFSQFPTSVQPLVLADVQETARRELDRTARMGHPHEAVIHTGDGFIVAYEWKEGDDGWLVDTAGRIAARLDKKNDDSPRINVHFRMSITLGPVYLTKDLLGRPNYVGDAITQTDRLLGCMPANLDDLVYFSDAVYRKHREPLMDRFARLGSGTDKHGGQHRLYSLEYLEYALDLDKE
jgi:class 3 adenylate cyclase